MTISESRKTIATNERRAFRYSVGLAADYAMYDDWYECEILDACSRGAAIKTKQALLPGDGLRLRVMLEGRTAFIDARVAHASGTKAGLAFEDDARDLVEEFLTLIDDFLVQKARRDIREYFKRYREEQAAARSARQSRAPVPVAPLA